MTSAMAAPELRFIVAELQRFINGRIDTVSSLGLRDILLQVYCTGVGKVKLRVFPQAIYAVATTLPAPAAVPLSFCLKLRKHLKNARLRAVMQHGSERVVELQCSSKEGRFSLFVELFGHGNVILCDAQQVILAAAEARSWKTRRIAVRERYVLPPSRLDLFSLSSGVLRASLVAAKSDSVVKALARDLGMGGVYAEELCMRSSVNKEKLPAMLTPVEAKKLQAAWQQLLRTKPEPVAVFLDGKAVAATPFPLQYYAAAEQKAFPTYSAALDAVFSTAFREEMLHASPVVKKRQQLEKRILLQEAAIAGLQRSITENTAAGNSVYEHYAELKALLETAKRYRKTKDSKLKKQLEAYACFTSFDEKTGTLTVDVQ